MAGRACWSLSRRTTPWRGFRTGFATIATDGVDAGVWSRQSVERVDVETLLEALRAVNGLRAAIVVTWPLNSAAGHVRRALGFGLLRIWRVRNMRADVLRSAAQGVMNADIDQLLRLRPPGAASSIGSSAPASA